MRYIVEWSFGYGQHCMAGLEGVSISRVFALRKIPFPLQNNAAKAFIISSSHKKNRVCQNTVTEKLITEN